MVLYRVKFQRFCYCVVSLLTRIVQVVSRFWYGLFHPTISHNNIHHRPYLTPLSRVLLEKLTDFQLIKNFPAFYGTRRFITAISARHLFLSRASPIQSTSHFLRIHLNIILPCTPGSLRPQHYTCQFLSALRLWSTSVSRKVCWIQFVLESPQYEENPYPYSNVKIGFHESRFVFEVSRVQIWAVRPAISIVLNLISSGGDSTG